MSDDDRRITLTALAQFELARYAGFDTYDDFVRWKEEKPDEYGRWYEKVAAQAAAAEESD